MTDQRPVCADQPGDPVKDPISEILALIGLGSTAVGVIVGVIDVMKGAAAFTLLGVGAIPLAGVAAAAAVFAVTIYMFYSRCASRDGGARCWAGVVNGVTDSFDSGWDFVFPSGAMHPRVDVVVKARFWPLVTQNAAFVACSAAPPEFGSPMIGTYYKSEKVCAAGVGAMVGAGVGLAAAIATALAIGAIGCAFPPLCLLFLLIAVLIGAAIALAGAAVGGQIGRALADDDDPTANGGASIAVGDLVSVTGKLLTMEEFEGANVGWWAEATTLHGRVEGQPAFADTHAAQLIDDACPLRDSPVKPEPNPEPKSEPEPPDIH
ncbi:hypothetical protein [Brevundimonas sp.]|jgi:hypothetical protein|uniref:hypothetical protein n=1 Tax=Brevundimonas sp. TaxID=1871086 RepID=UPI0037BF63F9